MNKKITIRLDEQTSKMLADLLELHQMDSITKLTNSDVVRNAILYSHQTYFPNVHQQINSNKNNLN